MSDKKVDRGVCLLLEFKLKFLQAGLSKTKRILSHWTIWFDVRMKCQFVSRSNQHLVTECELRTCLVMIRGVESKSEGQRKKKIN